MNIDVLSVCVLRLKLTFYSKSLFLPKMVTAAHVILHCFLFSVCVHVPLKESVFFALCSTFHFHTSFLFSCISLLLFFSPFFFLVFVVTACSELPVKSPSFQRQTTLNTCTVHCDVCSSSLRPFTGGPHPSPSFQQQTRKSVNMYIVMPVFAAQSAFDQPGGPIPGVVNTLTPLLKNGNPSQTTISSMAKKLFIKISLCYCLCIS